MKKRMRIVRGEEKRRHQKRSKRKEKIETTRRVSGCGYGCIRNHIYKKIWGAGTGYNSRERRTGPWLVVLLISGGFLDLP